MRDGCGLPLLERGNRSVEDEKIIDLYWNRDEQAIVETDRKYGRYCHTIIGRVLPSEEDTEECLNDTWLHTWNAIPPTRPVVLRLFLAKIARSLAFNHYNANTAKMRGGGEVNVVLDELAECVAAPGNVEDQILAEELGKSLDSFLRTLPEREANIFLRRYFFTEPVSDIAKRFGLTENNVMVILSRTRGKIRQYLQKEGLMA